MKNLGNKIYEEMNFEEVVSNYKLLDQLKNMNKVDIQDVSFMSLALGAFSGATTYLVGHDYPVAAGLFVAGIVLIYIYHKLGSSTS